MHAALRQLPANHPESLNLIAELDALLARHTPREHMHGLHVGEEADPRLRFFVLDVDDAIAGCGALRELEPGMAELKRMFVRSAFRGNGYGRFLLQALEREAATSGITRLRLETGPTLSEALSLYRSAGFVDIAKYGEYVTSPTSMCMEKRLALA
ncbi:MAG: GNAT family N-acetyltransferase [bacterium]